MNILMQPESFQADRHGYKNQRITASAPEYPQVLKYSLSVQHSLCVIYLITCPFNNPLIHTHTFSKMLLINSINSLISSLKVTESGNCFLIPMSGLDAVFMHFEISFYVPITVFFTQESHLYLCPSSLLDYGIWEGRIQFCIHMHRASTVTGTQ